jgi:hypothetical protein
MPAGVVLGQEEDLGFKAYKNFDTFTTEKSNQWRAEVPRDIITGAESEKRLVDYWGIKSNELDKIAKRCFVEYHSGICF